MGGDGIYSTLKRNLETERFQLSRAVRVLMDVSRVIHSQPKYDWNADPENLTRKMGDVFIDNTDIITGMNKPQKSEPAKNTEPPENTYLIGYRITDGKFVYGVHGSNRVVYGPQYDAYHGNKPNANKQEEPAKTVYPCMSPNATFAETPTGLNHASVLPAVIPDVAAYRRAWRESQAEEREARYERFERLETGFISYFARSLDRYMTGSGIAPDDLRFEEHFLVGATGTEDYDWSLACEAVFETHQDFGASVLRIRKAFQEKGWVLSIFAPDGHSGPKRVVRIFAIQEDGSDVNGDTREKYDPNYPGT